MAVSRNFLLDNVRACMELLLDDESWQGGYDDDERRIWLSAVESVLRLYAYRGLSPRAQLPRIRRMLSAGRALNA